LPFLFRHSSHLSHTADYLALVIFMWGLALRLGWSGWWSFHLCFSALLGWQFLATGPNHLWKWSLVSILPGLFSNYHPPNLYISESWDYKFEPVYQAHNRIPTEKLQEWPSIWRFWDWGKENVFSITEHSSLPAMHDVSYCRAFSIDFHTAPEDLSPLRALITLQVHWSHPQTINIQVWRAACGTSWFVDLDVWSLRNIALIIQVHRRMYLSIYYQ
jgi:hypothetical protein